MQARVAPLETALPSLLAQVHACPICPKEFPSHSKLQRHIVSHTGEKPFQYVELLLPCIQLPSHLSHPLLQMRALHNSLHTALQPQDPPAALQWPYRHTHPNPRTPEPSPQHGRSVRGLVPVERQPGGDVPASGEERADSLPDRRLARMAAGQRPSTVRAIGGRSNGSVASRHGGRSVHGDGCWIGRGYGHALLIRLRKRPGYGLLLYIVFLFVSTRVRPKQFRVTLTR